MSPIAMQSIDWPLRIEMSRLEAVPFSPAPPLAKGRRRMRHPLDPVSPLPSGILTTRRRFLGVGAAAATAAALGTSFLAACGSNGGGSAGTASTIATADDGSPASGLLRVSNWPLYIADGFVADFQKATGLNVDYQENYNDDEEWFAKNKEPLSRRQDIGCDLVVPSEVIAARLRGLGWLSEIRESRWPNKKNLQPAILNASIDPGRKFTAPYMSGLVGLAYNRAATGRDITTIDDLWDPALKGRVSLLSDTQDGLGMIMLSQGNSPENPSMDTVQKAIDLVKEHKDKGQIRRFTGNDYADDLPPAILLSRRLIRVTWCSCRLTTPI